MLRKLYALVHQNGCKPDDPDSPMMQEILLPGHLYLGVLAVSEISLHKGAGMSRFIGLTNLQERLQQLLISMKTITQTLDAKKPYMIDEKGKRTRNQLS